MRTKFTNPGQVSGHNNPAAGTKKSKIGFVTGTALLALMAGSVGCVYETRHAREYSPPPPVYTESAVVVTQDEYVYYPGYQVYYSNNRHQYIYHDGHSWVSRPAPPRVSSEVLFSSPSVRLDFHDHPSRHHTTVARQYPQNWAPPSQARGPNQGRAEHN